MSVEDYFSPCPFWLLLYAARPCNNTAPSSNDGARARGQRQRIDATKNALNADVTVVVRVRVPPLSSNGSRKSFMTFYKWPRSRGVSECV